MEALKLFSHGKILLTGEYTVLKGAKALGLPTKAGQKMNIVQTKKNYITWITKCQKTKKELINITFSKDLSEIIKAKPEGSGNEILKLLRLVKKMNPDLFKRSYHIETIIEFDRNWGLGTSASLIANLSKWAQLNPFELLDASFEGSGYDVVVSLSGKPILYQLTGVGRKWEFVNYYPKFHKNLFFVYLNKKQPTYPVIQRFKKVDVPKNILEDISQITEQIVSTKNLDEFSELIEKHEEITAKVIGKKPIGKKLFADFSGVTKSLGAWGGDLILAAGDQEKTTEYFKEKGYKTVMPFSQLIKHP